ncbi:alpha/beta fold hydrolase [Aquabacterium sp. A08]|uniref:alpha/beta fold hydrolase n=1 Tax=Aquabacterium sp. A08 TaxID=2718532 RepID=UPI00141EAEA8|nr:alpha/beta fold hydrolase [Aquabacterium sp. A08]NIC43648.1 alpha/beta fold hydrolase [Aquabacterium sp. A08]
MTPPPRIYPRPPDLWHLPLGAGRRMAYRVLGRPDAAPWLVLHGGPGSGGNPGLWQPFDLSRQRVVVPDQRGSGRSTPRGDTRGHTLDALVRDLETLRRHLRVERWRVLGGSWGATLAVHYAAQHPDAVERLVLRGAFDARPRTVQRLFLRFGSPQWGPRGQWGSRPVLHRLSQLLQAGTLGVTQQRALTHWHRLELAAAWHGVRRAQRHAPAGPLRVALQAHRRGLQRAARRASGLPLPPRVLQAAWQKFRVQAHVLARGGGWRAGSWSAQVARIARAGIPCDWVHGRCDTVCAPQTSLDAWQWQNRLRPGVARLHPTHAGHLGTDPDNARALRNCVSRPTPAVA